MGPKVANAIRLHEVLSATHKFVAAVCVLSVLDTFHCSLAAVSSCP